MKNRKKSFFFFVMLYETMFVVIIGFIIIACLFLIVWPVWRIKIKHTIILSITRAKTPMSQANLLSF